MTSEVLCQVGKAGRRPAVGVSFLMALPSALFAFFVLFVVKFFGDSPGLSRIVPVFPTFKKCFFRKRRTFVMQKTPLSPLPFVLFWVFQNGAEFLTKVVPAQSPPTNPKNPPIQTSSLRNNSRLIASNRLLSPFIT